MKILITGINSALGTAVAAGLAGHEVIGLGRTRHATYPTITCDFANGVPRLPCFDVCVHLAFNTDPEFCRAHPQEAFRINVEGTIRLLEQAHRFVFVSTGYVYGFRDGVLSEDLEPDPADAYAEMKLLAERAAAKHPDAVILRCFFPYGPLGKPRSLISRLIQNIAAGAAVEIHEEERPRTNPIYLSDLAAATRVFCEKGLRGIYNVGGDEVVSIKHLAEMIGTAMGTSPRFRPSGRNIKNMVGGIDKLRQVFRQSVDLKTGIAATVQHWMKAAAAAA